MAVFLHLHVLLVVSTMVRPDQLLILEVIS
jgi:hypothetical protein